MNNHRIPWSPMTYVTAFLLGVILFWTFGKDWLDLESASIFLAGLIGIAVAVRAFKAWNTSGNSHHRKNKIWKEIKVRNNGDIYHKLFGA